MRRTILHPHRSARPIIQHLVILDHVHPRVCLVVPNRVMIILITSVIMAQVEFKRDSRPAAPAGDLVVDPLRLAFVDVGVVPEGEDGVVGDRGVAGERGVVVVPGAVVEGEEAVGGDPDVGGGVVVHGEGEGEGEIVGEVVVVGDGAVDGADDGGWVSEDDGGDCVCGGDCCGCVYCLCGGDGGCESVSSFFLGHGGSEVSRGYRNAYVVVRADVDSQQAR